MYIGPNRLRPTSMTIMTICMVFAYMKAAGYYAYVGGQALSNFVMKSQEGNNFELGL